MEDNKSKVFFNRVDSNVILFLGTMIFGGIVILFGYIISRYARYHDELDSTKDTVGGEKNKGVDSRDSFSGSTTTSNVNKRTKNKKRREVQQEFSHSWVVGTLKGHTSTIFNMSFSSNGKQLASCAEDGKRPKQMRSVARQAISTPATAKAPVPSTASSYSYLPNQRKRVPSIRCCYIPNNEPRYITAIYNPQPPGQQYHWIPHNAEYQYQQLYIPEYNQNNKNACKLNHYQQEARNVYYHQLYMQLMSFQQLFGGRRISNHNNWQFQNLYNQQLSSPQLRQVNIESNYHTVLFRNGVSPYWMEGRYPSKKTYGFVHTKRCEFIINDTILEYVLRTYVHHPLYLIEAGYPCTWNFDARFQQFVNNLHKPFILKNPNGQGGAINNVQTTNDQNNKFDNDEQQTRDWVRSSSFTSSSKRAFLDESMRQRSSSISSVVELNSFEIRCSMCLKAFYLYRANGDLNRQEVCIHHPGELIFYKQEKVKTWTCCRNRASVLGCKKEPAHIWKNFRKNFASPQIDYVRTKPTEVQPENRIYGIYGIDCEMVTTRNGLELAKVSLVNIHGHIVYNEYVIPRSDVIDYNTRFSGITAEILAKATKTLEKVQQDLLEFIKAETILIGHALENDLKVLRIIHYTCIDTALLFKHPSELPFRHSLRVLSKGYLNRVVQKGSHDSVEDTLSALDLVLFKLRDDGF